MDLPAAAKFTSYCMLRFNVDGEQGMLAIGYTSPQAQQSMEQLKLVNSAPDESSNKLLKTNLMKGLYQAFANQLQAEVKTCSSANVVQVQGKDLGLWNEFTVTKTVQFTYGTPFGDLVLEMPLC